MTNDYSSDTQPDLTRVQRELDFDEYIEPIPSGSYLLEPE
jgi:hypothetical protein